AACMSSLAIAEPESLPQTGQPESIAAGSFSHLPATLAASLSQERSREPQARSASLRRLLPEPCHAPRSPPLLLAFRPRVEGSRPVARGNPHRGLPARYGQPGCNESSAG